MNIIIPCHSNMPDRDHDAVVLQVSKELVRLLADRMVVFLAAAGDDPSLYKHEYHGGPVHYATVGGEEIYRPDDLDDLTSFLKEMEQEGALKLEYVQDAYLSVTEHGFFYSWPGSYSKHGPSETYETEIFTLERIQEVYAQLQSHPPSPLLQ